MDEETLPPSPNWYLSNVLACASDGSIVYGSRNNIIITKHVPGNLVTRTPQISIIPNAHKERVTVVCFSTSKESNSTYWNCLASAGDDSVIRLWNLDTLTLVLAHNSHMEGMKVCSMDWSKLDSNLIVSADESGSIVCWDLFSNTTQQFTFGKLVPTCLACCPHRRDLVAIGTRSGLVCTISLKGDGKMLHRLRGHDLEVVSLAWCPVSYNVLQQKEPKNDMLLASGAKEKAIYVWRAGGDGRYETALILPTVPLSQETSGAQQHRSRLNNSTVGGNVGGGNWICVSWPDPTTILSSSLWGELLAFNLEHYSSVKSNKQSSAKLWRLVHACHVRGLFSIACAPVPELVKSRMNLEQNGSLDGIAGNGLDTNYCEDKIMPLTQLPVAWTTAQDRHLVACNWKTGEVVVNVPTLGGFVYCLATSPLDSNRIAIGVGDGTIRVWNLSNSTSLDFSSFWQKIKGKVMALAWHPAKEGWIAFGTSEGRVGLYDVSSGKQPILFRPHHRRNVYTLCWGPPVYKTDAAVIEGHFLYSCGDGEIVQYDSNKPNEEPYNLKDMFQVHTDVSSKKDVTRTDFAWKPDYTLLAVGNEDGTVNIMSAPHLTLVHTLYAHKKLVQCVAWHPESTATDTSYSPYRHWLAVASNETHIKVFDMSHLVKDDGDVQTEQIKSVQNCVTLSGHLNRVVSMCWSPHIGGQLVSVSYDETAQIWNVPTQQPVANFCSHSGNVLCCVWSPFDPDVVITGSSDFTLRAWRISGQTQSLPAERRKQKKLDVKKMKAVTTETSMSQPKEGDEKISVSTSSVEEANNAVEFARNEKEACEASAVQSYKKKKSSSRKSFFPLSSHQPNENKELHFNNCCHLLKALRNTSPQAEVAGDGIQTYELPTYLGFFGDRNSMQKLLDMEMEHHNSSGNFEMAQHIDLWKGNITEMLKEAARRKQLSDWLVSLAPMASQRLWMEMCKAYSEQLVICGQYQKAASYLLVCHKVNEAIELLVSHQLFREALAIARSRLGPEDPTPKRIICEWGRQVASEGNYELAVECLISVGELIEAAMLIRKRNDESSLKLAALIADEAGAHDLASMLASQSMKQSLLVGKWDVANEVVSQQPHLKHLVLLITAHQTIAEMAAVTDSSLYFKWLHKCNCLPSDCTPLHELILSRWQDNVSDTKAQDIYVALFKEFGKNESPDTTEKLWFVVSVELALACVSDGIKRLRHLVSAMSACYQYKQIRTTTRHFLLQLCVWITPQGPFAERSVFCSNSTDELKDIVRSLQAYLCAGVVDWISEYLETLNVNVVNKIVLSDTELANITAGNLNLEGCKYCHNSGQWYGCLEVLKVCKDSVLARESLQYFQDCVKIKKWENEVATALAKSRKPVADTTDGGCDSNVSSSVTNVSDDDNADNILLKLEQLKERKQEFETVSISTPNPFVIYCKIKTLLFHILKDDPKSCGDLWEQFESLWKNVTSHT